MSALNRIHAERSRQITAEGYSSAHDDSHGPDELISASIAYFAGDPTPWPWQPNEFKPKTRERDLVRAGALALAARESAERLGRASTQESASRLFNTIAKALDAHLAPPR